MLDKEKAKSWVEGRITLDDGAVILFEFSPDSEFGGGSVKIDKPSFPYDGKMLGAASQVLASRITDLLSRGQVLFSALNSGDHGPATK